MKTEDMVHDMASILFEPEILIALRYYNDQKNQARQNTVAFDLMRKREVLQRAYAQWKGQQGAGKSKA